jgi:DNA polymerase IV (DinB-like DNA polymerase)
MFPLVLKALQASTKDEQVLLKFLLNELVDKLYERVTSYGYQFKTVAVKIVRSDFSVETREMSYSIYQTNIGSITSVIQALLDRFLFDDNAAKIRKVGLKVSKLIRIEKKRQR